jgi:senataxin
MEPGDFWKHFRDWNILQHFVESNTTATSTSSNKLLPDTFVSHGHYISAWAPLCLAEARAQVMSDYQSSPAYKKSPLLPVSVKPVTKDGSTMLDSLQLQVYRQRKPKQQKQATTTTSRRTTTRPCPSCPMI